MSSLTPTESITEGLTGAPVGEHVPYLLGLWCLRATIFAVRFGDRGVELGSVGAKVEDGRLVAQATLPDRTTVLLLLPAPALLRPRRAARVAFDAFPSAVLGFASSRRTSCETFGREGDVQQDRVQVHPRARVEDEGTPRRLSR